MMNTLVIDPKVIESEGRSSIFFNDVMKYVGNSSESQKEAYRRNAIQEIRRALKTTQEF